MDLNQFATTYQGVVCGIYYDSCMGSFGLILSPAHSGNLLPFKLNNVVNTKEIAIKKGSPIEFQLIANAKKPINIKVKSKKVYDINFIKCISDHTDSSNEMKTASEESEPAITYNTSNIDSTKPKKRLNTMSLDGTDLNTITNQLAFESPNDQNNNNNNNNYNSLNSGRITARSFTLNTVLAFRHRNCPKNVIVSRPNIMGGQISVVDLDSWDTYKVIRQGIDSYNYHFEKGTLDTEDYLGQNGAFVFLTSKEIEPLQPKILQYQREYDGKKHKNQSKRNKKKKNEENTQQYDNEIYNEAINNIKTIVTEPISMDYYYSLASKYDGNMQRMMNDAEFLKQAKIQL